VSEMDATTTAVTDPTDDPTTDPAPDPTAGPCPDPNCIRPNAHPGVRHRYKPTKELAGKVTTPTTEVAASLEVTDVERIEVPEERPTVAAAVYRPTAYVMTPIDGGKRFVAWDTCANCLRHISQCTDPKPKEPEYITRWASELWPVNPEAAAAVAKVPTPVQPGDDVADAVQTGVESAIEKLTAIAEATEDEDGPSMPFSLAQQEAYDEGAVVEDDFGAPLPVEFQPPSQGGPEEQDPDTFPAVESDDDPVVPGFGFGEPATGTYSVRRGGSPLTPRWSTVRRPCRKPTSGTSRTKTKP
jgi:hypothetical protein